MYINNGTLQFVSKCNGQGGIRFREDRKPRGHELIIYRHININIQDDYNLTMNIYYFNK